MAENSKLCPNCRTVLVENATFCVECGSRIDHTLKRSELQQESREKRGLLLSRNSENLVNPFVSSPNDVQKKIIDPKLKALETTKRKIVFQEWGSTVEGNEAADLNEGDSIPDEPISEEVESIPDEQVCEEITEYAFEENAEEPQPEEAVYEADETDVPVECESATIPDLAGISETIAEEEAEAEFTKEVPEIVDEKADEPEIVAEKAEEPETKEQAVVPKAESKPNRIITSSVGGGFKPKESQEKGKRKDFILFNKKNKGENR